MKKKYSIPLVILLALAVIGTVSAWRATSVQMQTAKALQNVSMQVKSLQEQEQADPFSVAVEVQVQNGGQAWDIAVRNLSVGLYMDGDFVRRENFNYKEDRFVLAPGASQTLPPAEIPIPDRFLPLTGEAWGVQVVSEMELPIVGVRNFRHQQAFPRGQ